MLWVGGNKSACNARVAATATRASKPFGSLSPIPHVPPPCPPPPPPFYHVSTPQLPSVLSSTPVSSSLDFACIFSATFSSSDVLPSSPRMTSMTGPSYISKETLMSMLRSPKPPVVIDVREDDRIGGHIKSSIHVPAPELRRDPSRYLKCINGADTVVFHCMYSQLRGPTCAVRFWYALDNARKEGRVQNVPEVVILEGGFAGLVKGKKLPDDLIEAFDRRYHPST